jgi:hypothetical protein
MNLSQKLHFIEHNLEIGGYTIVAKECVGLIEQALRQLFRDQLTYLTEHDRLNIQDAERSLGKGEKGVERFTMGQLVNLFRTAHFLDAWERASRKDLSELRVINLDELTKLRNRFIHDDREATRAQAEFLFNCVRVMLETFDLFTPENAQEPSPPEGSPEQRGAGNVSEKNSLNPVFTQGHALIIGVGADLPDTVNDAVGLAEILRDPERCAYPPAQVTILTSEQATRAAILTALEKLAQTTDADSTVMIYFSGHGYQVISPTGEVYYLMPYGYDLRWLYKTALSGAEFTEKLKAIPARKLLVLLDCCHAGGVGDAKSPGLNLTKKPLPPEVLPLLAEGTGRVLIASSTENELSFAGKPYSAFTLALIEAFCGKGAAKQDGYVRVADLALHAREVVPGRTKGQQHPILHFEHADNFVLAYYAAGDTQPKELPFTETPEVETIPQPQAVAPTSTLQNTIATGGGDISVTGDGNIIGGKVVIGNNNIIGRGNVKRK